MKKLIAIALLMSNIASGQKFELANQAGYCGTLATQTGYAFDGFSNQLSFRYHPLKHLAIAAFYEFNNWRPHAHSLGIAPEFTTRRFYAGINLSVTTFESFKNYEGKTQITWKFSPSLGYGAHIGAKQKISKRLSIVEQFGYNRFYMNWRTIYAPALNPQPLYHRTTFTETLNVFYLRAGLAYRL